MPWLAALPLIIDGIRSVLKLIAEMSDPGEQKEAKKDLKAILNDYGVHGDVQTLRGNLAQFPVEQKLGDRGSNADTQSQSLMPYH